MKTIKILLSLIATFAVPATGMQRSPSRALAHYRQRPLVATQIKNNQNSALQKTTAHPELENITRSKKSNNGSSQKPNCNRAPSAALQLPKSLAIKTKTGLQRTSYLPQCSTAALTAAGLGLAYYLSDDDENKQTGDVDFLLASLHQEQNSSTPLPTQSVQAQIIAPRTTVTQYHAAGIQPYAIDTNNEVWLLVGLDGFRRDFASDFGGSKDTVDSNNAMQTAAREGAEELLFILEHTQHDFERLLQLRNKFKSHFDMQKSNSHTYNFLLDQIENAQRTPSIQHDGYITYFVRIPYDPQLPHQFAQRKKQFAKTLPLCWNEKSSLHWVKLNVLLDALEKSSNNRSITLDANGTQIHFFDKCIESVRVAHKDCVFEYLQAANQKK